ncbi:MAG: hypothetical protein ACJAWV_004258 [Flammeovirgaceae bacterium]|jgi:hypothetical protein
MTYVGELSSPSGELNDYSKITKLGLSLGLSKRFTPRLTFETSFTFGRLFGDDNLVSNPNSAQEVGAYARNLHFRNDIFELSTTLKLDLFKQVGHYAFRQQVRPFLFGGVGFLTNNPQAKTPIAQGNNWVNLRDLGTEGQNIGLADKYAKIQLAGILGFGANFKISERLDLGLQFGYRQTTTDYLDDVGGKYVDLGLFEQNSLAQLLSDRSLEGIAANTGNIRNIESMNLPTDSYVGADGNTYETLNGYTPNNQSANQSILTRGSATAKDGYWVTGFRLRWILSNHKKEAELSRIHQVHQVPTVSEEVISDDFLRHRDRYKVSPLFINTQYSEIPTGFYKEGILIDSDRKDRQNKHGRDKGNFYNIYYAPFADMSRAEIIAPIKFPDPAFKKYNRVSAIKLPQQNKVVLAMFEDLASSKSNPHHELFEATISGENTWTNLQSFPFESGLFSYSHPTISADELTMYLVSDQPSGLGGTDIYVSHYKNESWTKPQNVGAPINTSKNEVYPFLHADKTLYFASDGHNGLGGLDIFEVIHAEEQVVEIVNLGAPINSKQDDFSLILSENKRAGYFASNRIGGVGSNDIYVLRVKALSTNMLLTQDNELQIAHQVKISGTVRDSISNLPIPKAYVRLNNMITDKLTVYRTNEKGNFSFSVSTSEKYEIACSALGYKSMRMREIQTINQNYDVKEVELAFELFPSHFKPTLEGRVIRENNKLPIYNAQIRLLNLNTQEEAVVTTGLKGNYIMKFTYGADYKATIIAEGFEPQVYEFNSSTVNYAEITKKVFRLIAK